MLRTLSHLFLGIASQVGALQDPGQAIIVLDASLRMAQTGVADTAIFDTVGEAVVESVTNPPNEHSDLRVGLRLAGGEPAGEGANPCESTTLILPPSEVLPERWKLAVADHRPRGECPLVRSIIAGLDDLESSSSPSRLVVITAGGDDCGGSREEVARALADGEHAIDLRVVGILLSEEAAAFFESVPLRNVENPDELGVALRWALFEGYDLEEPEIPETPTASVESSEHVLAGEPLEVRWVGPDAAEDFISLALPDDPGDAYVAWVRTDSGNPVVLTAPLQPGIYEIRYVSGTGAEALARSPVEVLAAAIEMHAPPIVVPEQRFEVRWTGSTAPGDFVALSRPDAPPDRMLDWASTTAGGPVTLAAPTRTGVYEVRFIRKSGLEILARVPVEVAR